MVEGEPLRRSQFKMIATGNWSAEDGPDGRKEGKKYICTTLSEHPAQP
jgi:hypothetical protein